MEDQAFDRIHRLGQHRPIQIMRLIIENSIESRILQLQVRLVDQGKEEGSLRLDGGERHGSTGKALARRFAVSVCNVIGMRL